MLVNDVKEKEPLPQSVEVLSHVAARAATFLVFAVTWTAFKWLRIVPRLALSFNLIQSCRLLSDCPNDPSYTIAFQSYAVMRTATYPQELPCRYAFQSYAFNLM